MRKALMSIKSIGMPKLLQGKGLCSFREKSKST